MCKHAQLSAIAVLLRWKKWTARAGTHGSVVVFNTRVRNVGASATEISFSVLYIGNDVYGRLKSILLFLLQFKFNKMN